MNARCVPGRIVRLILVSHGVADGAEAAPSSLGERGSWGGQRRKQTGVMAKVERSRGVFRSEVSANWWRGSGFFRADGRGNWVTAASDSGMGRAVGEVGRRQDRGDCRGGARVAPELREMVRSAVEPAFFDHDRLGNGGMWWLEEPTPRGDGGRQGECAGMGSEAVHDQNNLRAGVRSEGSFGLFVAGFPRRSVPDLDGMRPV